MREREPTAVPSIVVDESRRHTSFAIVIEKNHSHDTLRFREIHSDFRHSDGLRRCSVIIVGALVHLHIGEHDGRIIGRAFNDREHLNSDSICWVEGGSSRERVRRREREA